MCPPTSRPKESGWKNILPAMCAFGREVWRSAAHGVAREFTILRLMRGVKFVALTRGAGAHTLTAINVGQVYLTTKRMSKYPSTSCSKRGHWKNILPAAREVARIFGVVRDTLESGSCLLLLSKRQERKAGANVIEIFLTSNFSLLASNRVSLYICDIERYILIRLPTHPRALTKEKTLEEYSASGVRFRARGVEKCGAWCGARVHDIEINARCEVCCAYARRRSAHVDRHKCRASVLNNKAHV